MTVLMVLPLLFFFFLEIIYPMGPLQHSISKESVDISSALYSFVLSQYPFVNILLDSKVLEGREWALFTPLLITSLSLLHIC